MAVQKNGFCCRFTVKQTPDKGVGVFADEAIAQGSIVWRHVQGQYTVYNEERFRAALDKLSEAEAVYELTHSFGMKELPECVIRIFDDGVLINHSRDANLATNRALSGAPPIDATSSDHVAEVTRALLSDRYCLVAIRDIEIGEEFTIDYAADVSDPDFYKALYEHYGVCEDYLGDG